MNGRPQKNRSSYHSPIASCAALSAAAYMIYMKKCDRSKITAVVCRGLQPQPPRQPHKASVSQSAAHKTTPRPYCKATHRCLNSRNGLRAVSQPQSRAEDAHERLGGHLAERAARVARRPRAHKLAARRADALMAARHEGVRALSLASGIQ